MEKKIVGVMRGVRGVVSGISVGENLDELKKMMKGGKVTDIKRLEAFRDGRKVESKSVMIQFDEEVLPQKVMVGYMSFSVRSMSLSQSGALSVRDMDTLQMFAGGNKDVENVGGSMHMESVATRLCVSK